MLKRLSREAQKRWKARIRRWDVTFYIYNPATLTIKILEDALALIDGHYLLYRPFFKVLSLAVDVVVSW